MFRDSLIRDVAACLPLPIYIQSATTVVCMAAVMGNGDTNVEWLSVLDQCCGYRSGVAVRAVLVFWCEAVQKQNIDDIHAGGWKFEIG